jgi:hypothetical protein
MTPMKDRKFSFYMNFGPLNGIIEVSAEPSLIIHEVLKDFGEITTIFSSFDLRNEYWQILLTNRTKKYKI